jgi:hypothetical protein
MCFVLTKDSKYLKHYKIPHIYIHASTSVYITKTYRSRPHPWKELHEHTKLAIYMNMKSKTSLGSDHYWKLYRCHCHDTSLAFINCQTRRPQLHCWEHTRMSRGNNQSFDRKLAVCSHSLVTLEIANWVSQDSSASGHNHKWTGKVAEDLQEWKMATLSWSMIFHAFGFNMVPTTIAIWW